MAFLVVVGAVQFLYCVLAGNYVRESNQKIKFRNAGVLIDWLIADWDLFFLQPFNAFLSGFSAAVGQFVLTASLRMQTSPSPASITSSNNNKSSSKGKNAAAAGAGASEDTSAETSHERCVYIPIYPLLLDYCDSWTVANYYYYYFFLMNRAFADYIFGSLILHFFCINFIN